MRGGDTWEFGRFVADAREQQLRCEGRAVPLTARTFALLSTLLARPGQLFTKAELFDTVWSGRVVTDAALSRCIHELRAALGDDAASPTYVATVHGIGFRFIAPVSAGPQAPRSPLAAEQRLVGRDAELMRLDHALAETRAGRRQLVFISGEAGIGKTALVESFLARQAGTQDAPWVAQGRCIESYGTGEAFLPLFEVLEQLARHAGAEPFRTVLGRYAPAWLAQLPWLARDAAGASSAFAADDATPQRMLREIAHALEVLAAQRPLVLWLEDLHWSDPSSLAVLSFLAGRRDAARLLLIGTYRPDGAQLPASPLQSLALRLAQRGQARTIALGALDEGAMKRLLARRLGRNDASPALIDELGAFLHRRSEGHALFAVTLVEDLIQRGTLRREGDRWVLRDNVATLIDHMPDSLRLLVHEQCERLTKNDRRLLEAAAVSGAEFSAATVAAALGADAAEVEDRFADLAQQGRFIRAHPIAVSWPDGTVAASFGFLHALYWQGIHDRVPHGRRIEWQRRIGVRQEQAYGARCGSIAAELAMRFEAARDLDRSVRYLQLAGASALARCAYPECIALLRRGIELVPQLPEARRPRQELDLLLPLGAALMATKGYADDEVDGTYARARALCLVCANPGDLERTLRGQWNVAFIRADLAGARALAEQLLEHAQASRDDDLALDARIKLGQNLLHQGELAAARRQLEQSLMLSADGHPARLRSAPRVAIYLAWALWYAGLGTQAVQRAEQALILAADAGSPHSSAFAHGYGMILHVLRGDLARALELAPQLTSIIAEHGLLYWRLVNEFVRGMIAARQGDPELGRTVMRRATEAMRATGAKVGVPYLLCLLAETELARGNVAEARLALGDAAALVATTGNALYSAEAARLEGDLALLEPAGPAGRERAEAHYRRAIGLAREQGARAFELRAATSLARLFAAEGKPRRAAELLGPAHAAFTEGFDSVDWLRAKALLKELSTSAPAPSTSSRGAG